MRLSTLLQPRICLFAAGALCVATILMLNHDAPRPPDEGIVWVYRTSLCATAGDASDCSDLAPSPLRIFGSMEACVSHRDEDLAQAANPRLLGTCKRQHEA